MIGKKVKGYYEGTKTEVIGIVESKGCFPNSYEVNLGNLYVPLFGNFYDNKVLFFEDDLTIVE